MLRFFYAIICTLLMCAAAFDASSQDTPTSDDTPNRILGANTPPENITLADSAPQEALLASGTYAYRSFIKETRIRDRSGVYPEADITSFSYELDGPDVSRMRPVIFMFNGGPGSSSIWLHMTGFGPDKTSVDLLSETTDPLPQTRAPNAGFLIDVGDLVFVDPIGTGLSRVGPTGAESEFYDLRVDARAMCRFAQNWLQAEDRLGAPVYIVGVSYSTLRAAGMASHSTCRDFRRNLHGLIFVSGLLDLRMRHAQDLWGRVSRYPSIAAVAWFRGHVDTSLWPEGLDAFLAAMEQFADDTLAPAIARAHRMTDEETQAIIETLYAQIGLAPPTEQIRSVAAAIQHAQLVVDGDQTACGYDARLDCGRGFGPHPSLPLTTFGKDLEDELATHLKENLNYHLDQQAYKVMRGNRFRANWDYRFHKSAEVGAGTNMAQTLVRRLPRPRPKPDSSKIPLLKNMVQPFTTSPQPQPVLTRIMVASGIYDFVTPYYAMELALLRAGLTPEQFQMHLYQGGHMMYLDKDIGHQLAADIRSFIRDADHPS